MWKENDGVTRPIYKAAMSCNRFKEILTSIRFDDMDTREARKQFDRLAPLREVTDVFAGNCKIMYTASPYGTIDEQLVTFRGRCAFRVYICQTNQGNKASQFFVMQKHFIAAIFKCIWEAPETLLKETRELVW